MNAPNTALESQRSSDVKYMLMMHAPRAGWTTAGIGSWPPEDFNAHIAFMVNFSKALSEAGELRELCAPARAAHQR